MYLDGVLARLLSEVVEDAEQVLLLRKVERPERLLVRELVPGWVGGREWYWVGGGGIGWVRWWVIGLEGWRGVGW